MCTVFFSATAAEPAQFRLRFRINRIDLDPALFDNSKALENIRTFLSEVEADSTLTLVRVSIRGTASPEGPYGFNMYLAKGRRDALMDYLVDSGLVDPAIITLEESGLAWEELAEELRLGNLYYRDEALRIIADAPKVGGKDTRKERLEALDGGRVWEDMRRRIFPRIRCSSSLSFTIYRESPIPSVKFEYNPRLESETSPRPKFITGGGSNSVGANGSDRDQYDLSGVYFNLSTNLLTDLALVPNVKAEYYLGGNFSVAASYAGSWWKTEPRWFWQYYGADLGLNYYFGKAARVKPLQGHHAGLYAQAFTYDFLLGGKGQMGCLPGGNILDLSEYSFGVEYGYSMPIARRLNLDICAGAGFIGGKYYEYELLDGHYVWTATKQRSYFGPTKFRIGLVWQLGRHNVNKGER